MVLVGIANRFFGHRKRLGWLSRGRACQKTNRKICAIAAVVCHFVGVMGLYSKVQERFPLAPETRMRPKSVCHSLVFRGTHQTMHMLYRFKGDDPRNNLPLGGSPGVYEVTFILHRPGYKLQQERQLSFSSGLRGDSHLAISKPAFSPARQPRCRPDSHLWRHRGWQVRIRRVSQ